MAAARAALPRWSRLRPARAEERAEEQPGIPEILTPEQAVNLLGGSISVAGLRARIRKGTAGPWKRVGGKLQIRASAFLGFHAAQPGEALAVAQRRGEMLERLAERHRPRRQGTARAGAGPGATLPGDSGAAGRRAT